MNDRLAERIGGALDRVDAYHAEWSPRMRDEVDRKWLRAHEVAIVVAAAIEDRDEQVAALEYQLAEALAAIDTVIQGKPVWPDVDHISESPR
jgi:hypothetical protein